MSFKDYIDKEDIEFVNELENPPKYHCEADSEDLIHFFVDGKELDCDDMVDLLNEQEERIRELLQDNDHKFWKLQFMHQFNSTSLIMHEISLAIKEGYEVSDKFKEYLNECKIQNDERMKKANEQEKW